MTPIRFGAPVAALLMLSGAAWAQAPAAPATPSERVVRHRAYPEDYQDTQQAADALNGEELAQSPVVASPPHLAAVPVYPAPAYYPPPPPYYPPPPYGHP